MTGVTGIPDDVFERAVEAAESALFGRVFAVTLAQQSEYLRDAVTAALAEVVPNAQAAAWVEGYDAAAKQHPTTSFLGARNPYKKETR